MDLGGRFNAEGFYADLQRRLEIQGSKLNDISARSHAVCKQEAPLAHGVAAPGNLMQQEMAQCNMERETILTGAGGSSRPPAGVAARVLSTTASPSQKAALGAQPLRSRGGLKGASAKVYAPLELTSLVPATSSECKDPPEWARAVQMSPARVAAYAPKQEGVMADTSNLDSIAKAVAVMEGDEADIASMITAKEVVAPNIANPDCQDISNASTPADVNVVDTTRRHNVTKDLYDDYDNAMSDLVAERGTSYNTEFTFENIFQGIARAEVFKKMESLSRNIDKDVGKEYMTSMSNLLAFANMRMKYAKTITTEDLDEMKLNEREEIDKMQRWLDLQQNFRE